MCYTGSKKKMLVVCGDSFSYGKESDKWPAIIAKNLNMSLINLSIVGSSNYTICHQIQYTLDSLNPTYVVISLTAAERFEIDSNEFGPPATIKDFKTNINEITETNPDATISSGNLVTQLRNSDVDKKKAYLMNSSFRLSAQNQAWAINYLTSRLTCKFLLYRNIFPKYCEDISKYKNQYYYGIDNIINSGPYDYESRYCNTTNHLSTEDNIKFSNRVIDDLYKL